MAKVKHKTSKKKDPFSKKIRFKSGKKYKKILLGIVIVLASWFTIHTTYIIVEGLSDNIKPADMIVVFGNEVLPDGNVSDRLKARLDKALEIYRQGYSKTIVVSGGTGTSGFDEADVMKKYLIGHGVDANQILEDHNGTNTLKTAQNVALLKPQSVILVSQYFHITRAKLAFQKNGIQQIYSAHANYAELRDVYSIIREFFGYYGYLFTA